MYHKPPLQIMKGDCRLRLQDTAEIPRGWRRRPGEGKMQHAQDERIWKNIDTHRRERRKKEERPYKPEIAPRD
jgi:hypothetical protein